MDILNLSLGDAFHFHQHQLISGNCWLSVYDDNFLCEYDLNASQHNRLESITSFYQDIFFHIDIYPNQGSEWDGTGRISSHMGFTSFVFMEKCLIFLPRLKQ